MLRPEPMSRVLVVGPRDQLEPVIESLHRLRLVHLVDHRGEDEVFSIGKPLPRAAEVSENLIRLRSIANLLKLGEAEPRKGAEKAEDVRERIANLELLIREEDESRKRMEGLVQDLNRQIEDLRPFAALRLPLELLRGYDSLAVVVGRVTAEVRGLAAVVRESEAFVAEGVIAVFVAKESAGPVREHLAKFGFAELDVPKADGNPADLLRRAEGDRDKWVARLSEIEERIAKLRDRYARFIVRTEERFQVEIEKAEAPLRFAVSDHSFVIDGWVPTARLEGLQTALDSLPGLHVDVLEDRGGHVEDAEAPPVLLRNRGPARRFEFLTRLYSTPRHDEVDPTAFMFVLFPIFFGLMIGDVGYGIVMVVLGALLSMKLRDNADFADLMRVVLYGGFFAFLFGLLLYGEIFGVPFHPPPGAAEELSWSDILGYTIPYSAPIHKLEAIGVIDLLLISIVASFIHLGLGFAVGFVNEWSHSKRHALGKLGWLIILIGMFSFFAVLGRTPAWCEFDLGNLGCETASNRVVNQIFLDNPPFAWIPAAGLALGGMVIPYFMVGAIAVGAVLLFISSPLELLEIISVLSNMMSYTRLAGVAVAKGAVALAFNTMFLPLIIDEPLFHDQGIVALNPNVLFIFLGFVLMFLAHAMVLILGAISAGIQSIRLNYVEFFLKFYKGGGTLFSPFGERTKTEVTT